jgi:peptidylprolyl isomerase
MTILTRRGLAAAAGLLAAPSVLRAQNARPTINMELKDGRVVIETRPDLAPRHVERVVALTQRGFYDNCPFHRVIPGFMAQTGDPTGTGTGGARSIGMPDLAAEFSPPNRARFIRGTCGMARTQDPNTANSQFFIMFAPASGLDGQYTIWGSVISGMEYVDRIKAGTQANNGAVPPPPDRIRRMTLGS